MSLLYRYLRHVRRRSHTLPAVTGAAGRPVPGTVKELSTASLSELMAKNTAAGRGANGRPRWLAENSGSVRRVVLFAQNFKSGNLLRCNAVLFGSGEQDWMFSIDLALADFDDLPDFSVRETRLLLREFLLRVPVLPLDDNQLPSSNPT